MYIRRFSPTSQLVVKAVSDSKIKNGGAILFNWQTDYGKWGHEWMYSTHEMLVGLRTLYNFRFDEKMLMDPQSPSRLSIGMEFFYGIATNSPGMSTALRYTTQSAYTGTPLTLTVMCNPIMGHISATYSLRTTAASAFATKYDFNVYSYVSDLSLGCEIWRASSNEKLQAQEEISEQQEYTSVVKASTSLGQQNVRFLWEGRFREFLLSTGVSLSFAGETPLATGFGIQFQYAN
jgi:distribution and morphology protein 10